MQTRTGSGTWGLRVFVCAAILLGIGAADVMAGTPHLVYGTIRGYADFIPPQDKVAFKARMAARPNEILTQGSVGCGYGNGFLWVEAGNFPSAWLAGDNLIVTVYYEGTEVANWGLLMDNEGFQFTVQSLNVVSGTTDDTGSGLCFMDTLRPAE